MLEDVSFSLNLLKIFVQHRATSLAQQCRTMLAPFEQVLIRQKLLFLLITTITYMIYCCNKSACKEKKPHCVSILWNQN